MKVHSTRAVPGLPGPLPAGETILWQGAPDWRVLTLRAFHARAVAIYFGIILVIRAAFVVGDGGTIAEALMSALTILPLALAALALIALYAWGVARTTVYTITDKRTVLRIGIALPLTINIPHKIVTSADLRQHGHGAGDIALTLGDGRMGWFHLWPHARPFRMREPQPMLRGLADVTRPAGLLADALASVAGVSPVQVRAPQAEADKQETRMPEGVVA